MYLLRHGETEWNEAGRMQGQLDSPLTPRGLLQAKAMAEALAELTAGWGRPQIITSPLGRCQQTAKIVAEVLGASLDTLQSDARLAEMTWGQWDGLTREEIAKIDPDSWELRQEDKWNAAPPNGESYAMLTQRVGSWLADLPPEAFDDRPPALIVVSHGGVSRVLRGLYARLSPEDTLSLSVSQEEFYCLRYGFVGSISIADRELSKPALST